MMEKTPSPVPPLPASSAGPLPCHDLKSPFGRKAAKEEVAPAAVSPVSSLGGCNNRGLFNSQAQPRLSGGSRIQSHDLRLPKRRTVAGRRYQCSSDGCRLAFRSMKELLDHMWVHYRPTQSMEGKTFRCSTLGCAETFPCMQDLMGHMKAHYKPNRYFKCENCMSRFRTYRSLFKHLHVCSDSGGSSPALTAEKPVLPATSGPEESSAPPGKLLEELPKLHSVLHHMKRQGILPASMMAAAAAAADPLPASLQGSLEPAALPSPAPHAFPLVEPALFGPPALARFSGPPHASSAQGSLLPYVPPSTYALPQASVQNRLRPYLSSQVLPVSNAVWKKSQGHSSNSRIVWEHTRGRYNCLQCAFSTASREEMTQHTEQQHRKNPSPPARLDGEMDFDVALPALHSKLTPEMGGSLFSPL